MLLILCQEVSTLFFHTGPLLEAFHLHSNAPFFCLCDEYHTSFHLTFFDSCSNSLHTETAGGKSFIFL